MCRHTFSLLQILLASINYLKAIGNFFCVHSNDHMVIDTLHLASGFKPGKCD